MKIALDSNILLYAEGVDDPVRQARAIEIIATLPRGRLIIPVQVLGEVFNILKRKTPRDAENILAALVAWQKTADLAATTPEVFNRAATIAVQNKLQIWDAIILATAEEADCELLLSEDMQHGFEWRRITVINPFLRPSHPLLASALALRP